MDPKVVTFLPYVVLVRKDDSLEIVKAYWCQASDRLSAAKFAVLETLELRAEHINESIGPIKAELGLLELTGAGAPDGVTIFDDEHSAYTYEVVDITRLAEIWHWGPLRKAKETPAPTSSQKIYD